MKWLGGEEALLECFEEAGGENAERRARADLLFTPSPSCNRYEAKAPKDIKFAPLNKETAYDAEQLMTLYEVRLFFFQSFRFSSSSPSPSLSFFVQSDRHLAKFLPLIRDSPVYPVIYDSEDRVLSMPPIINSNRQSLSRLLPCLSTPTYLIFFSWLSPTDSKITLQTKNVFIDMTATDQTKL